MTISLYVRAVRTTELAGQVIQYFTTLTNNKSANGFVGWCIEPSMPKKTAVTAQTPAGWNPPPHLVPELQQILEHNRKHPERRIGAILISQWCARNNHQVSRHAVYRWMLRQTKEQTK